MLDENGFIVGKLENNNVQRIAPEIKSINKIEFMSDEELAQIPSGSIFTFDVECYVNFFYVAFKCLDNGKFIAFERSPSNDFNSTKLLNVLWRFCVVGFNSTCYDLPMIELAATGASCQELKSASDYIIKSGPNNGTEKVTPFVFEKKYGIKIGKYNHIDLIEVAPLQGSLKLYAGRLHCKRMQDLPIQPDQKLTEEDATVLRPYCCNDLSNTELLFNELAKEIKLRIDMSEEYGIDLRSKSDAQIAEAVVKSELKKLIGFEPKRAVLSANTALSYKIPDFIKFETEQLNDVLEVVRNAKFYIDGLGSPIMPVELEKLKVIIGKSTYKLGMGGLHSTEKKSAHYANENTIIADNDVESFYPRTILNQRLCPSNLGEAFLTVYEKIVSTRIKAKGECSKAKKSGHKADAIRYQTTADSLKIVINGLFGKFGNKYSLVYAPDLMLQVTITGQLVLLMLIEKLEKAGIYIFSGNTDGIVAKYNKSRHDEVRTLIAAWEAHTGYKTEETRYSAVFSRDVNSYVAIKTCGGDEDARFLDDRLGAKTKGAYCERGSALNSILSKNPETLICADAVVNFLFNEKPIEQTIKECKDFRRFVSVKNVKGGGQKNGIYLGKVVRWYYAKGEAGYISYVISGNKVGKTDGAKPVMDLPDQFPQDIDCEKYIQTAIDMLYDCGRFKEAFTKSLFFYSGP
jgi:hypothetical protein